MLFFLYPLNYIFTIMILVFGGTTEGKNSAVLLDFLSEPYFYSTKNKSGLEIQGSQLHGAKTADEISEFCQNKSIKLIIDAAHPFAKELHKNIYNVAEKLNITTIRFERTYPKLDRYENIRRFPSFQEMIAEIHSDNFKNILCLTGVQTIPFFGKIIKTKNCYFRVLDSQKSLQLARQYKMKDEFIIPSKPNESVDKLVQLIKSKKADVILTKESGTSGFFMSKVKASCKSNLPLWVVQRPKLPPFDYTVDSKKSLLQTFYTVRKQLKKTDDALRYGYTTGTCVTAAAKACFIALMEKKFPEQVCVQIPDGEMACFLVFPESLEGAGASCVVIKDAGDDPDITHAKEIGCELCITEKAGIRFVRGKGIGMVTMPGLQVKKGEPAINPVPRQMISSMLHELSGFYETEHGFDVKPFVPEGEHLAKQTFNPRVGVIGGISVIGTSGRVVPYSSQAFLSSVKSQLSVARESGMNEVILTSGKRSENILKPFNKHLPEIAFIHYGNLIGETLQMAIKKNFQKITLGVMFGKAIKLAEGYMDTHSKNSAFNPGFAAGIAKECGYPEPTVNKIQELKLANAIRDLIPFSQTQPFYNEIAKRCFSQTKTVVKEKAKLSFFLIFDNGYGIQIS
jgi:cobalt-precorrin-5B (C1)-methyltransferase